MPPRPAKECGETRPRGRPRKTTHPEPISPGSLASDPSSAADEPSERSKADKVYRSKTKANTQAKASPPKTRARSRSRGDKGEEGEEDEVEGEEGEEEKEQDLRGGEGRVEERAALEALWDSAFEEDEEFGFIGNNRRSVSPQLDDDTCSAKRSGASSSRSPLRTNNPLSPIEQHKQRGQSVKPPLRARSARIASLLNSLERARSPSRPPKRAASGGRVRKRVPTKEGSAQTPKWPVKKHKRTKNARPITIEEVEDSMPETPQVSNVAKGKKKAARRVSFLEPPPTQNTSPATPGSPYDHHFPSLSSSPPRHHAPRSSDYSPMDEIEYEPGTDKVTLTREALARLVASGPAKNMMKFSAGVKGEQNILFRLCFLLHSCTPRPAWRDTVPITEPLGPDGPRGGHGEERIRPACQGTGPARPVRPGCQGGTCLRVRPSDLSPCAVEWKICFPWGSRNRR
ncbi:hypothetical protein C8R44DRAFT_893130 [Mycena epipterygia]|nr:hypothetical protein C8R44DRAFT_893130 [Mycena epipterygia]